MHSWVILALTQEPRLSNPLSSSSSSPLLSNPSLSLSLSLYFSAMENYSYTASYPESGESSPRSREIEFENPPPWEDPSQPSPNYKVKFMCSYGGKIHPRAHDNQLSYNGGETKILAVDRNIKFSGIESKLSAICNADVCFKYQLPGEDLDALISVTNDDDLEHMMHEYDRLFRASAKPARLRLFLFPVNRAESEVFGSGETNTDRERLLEALNSSRNQSVDGSPPPARVAPDNVDFLFGLEKGAVVPPPPVAKLQDPIREPEIPVRAGIVRDDRVIGSDPVEVQRRIQELQRMQIGVEQAMYRPKSEENLTGPYAGDFYSQKFPENVQPMAAAAAPPVSIPASANVPPAYWHEKPIPGGGFPMTMTTNPAPEQQQMYMVQSPAGMYHAQMPRQVTGQATQGYYTVQRMAPEYYREQPVYTNTAPASAAPPRMAAYAEGINMGRPNTNGVGVTETGYTQVAYDSAGRQVYYGGGLPPQPSYQGMAAASAEMRSAGEGKVVTKVSQTSA